MVRAMHKRRSVLGLALAPLVPRLAKAQPLAKTFRVGLLSNFPAPVTGGRLWAGFIDALQQQGFVEGKNVSFELRNAEGRPERLPALAAELVRLNVDVFVVGGSASIPGMRAAKGATQTIPIVMAGIVDPVGHGFVASLARPGGNVTGVADFHMELEPKRLELLKVAAPGIVKVTHLVAQLQFGGQGTQGVYGAMMSEAAERLGVRVSHAFLNSPEGFQKAMAGIARDRPDALLVSTLPLFFGLRKEIADFAISQRLPTVSSPREMAAAGILLSYGSDLINSSIKAGALVGKILNGAKPGDLPVEQPDKFEIVVNLNTAKALGLTLPRTLIVQANELIT
jgi:putative ABC transport system substrate-binding protein